MEDDLKTVIRRLAADESKAEAQLDLLGGMEPRRRSAVADRLRTVDRFLRSDRTAGDAKAAADGIGTGVRNLYRLIARMQEVGPVGGLTPGYRGSKAKPAEEEAGGSIVDDWLRTFLRSNPVSSRARAEAYLHGRADAHNEANPDEPSIEVPGPSVVSARLDALRREGALAAGAIIGESVLVDQVVLSPMIRTGGARRHPVAATFVLDRVTTTILGVGIAGLPDDHGDGLASALQDLAKRVPTLASAGFGFAPTRALEWIVPPGLVDVALPALEQAASATGRLATGMGFDLSIVDAGERRHAVRTVKLLGNSLGRLRFLTRASLSPEADDHGNEERGPADGVETIEDVHRTLLAAASRWNSARIRLLRPSGGSKAQDIGAGLVDVLRSVFDPVLSTAQGRVERKVR